MEERAKDQLEIETKATTELKTVERRAFVLTAVGAIAAGGVWWLRRGSLGTVEASGETDLSGPVTIVQFASDGKRTGKVYGPAYGEAGRGVEGAAFADPVPGDTTRGQQSALTQAIPWTSMERGFFGASAAIRRCSAPRPSLSQGRDGRASGSRSLRRMCVRSRTGALG